jgi:thioesterase domain-containing protein
MYQPMTPCMADVLLIQLEQQGSEAVSRLAQWKQHAPNSSLALCSGDHVSALQAPNCEGIVNSWEKKFNPSD